MFDEQQPEPVERETVGAPTELADAEEIPDWLADIIKMLTAGPILIAFLCGGVPLGCAGLWCILSLLF